MGGYTTYNEKRAWDSVHETGAMKNNNHLVMDISDFNNMTSLEKQDFLRRYCKTPRISDINDLQNQHNENCGKRKWAREADKSSNHPRKVDRKCPNTSNGDWHASQDETTSADDEHVSQNLKCIPSSAHTPTSAVLENLKFLLKDGEDSKNLKFIIIGDGKNSRRHERSTTCEDKSVQADWTMVLETRDANSRLQELHSSTPNLSNENQRSDVRQMRRSVSDTEEDEERQRILSRAQKEVDASRQREDNLIAHLRDYRGRMEELHRKIALRDSNIKRLEAEICRLREVLVECRGKEKEMQSLISDLKLNISDQEAQYDEDMTLYQLREAELRHTIDELSVVNKHLRAENARLNIEMLQRLNKRSQDGKHLSLEGNMSGGNHPIHSRQSRSFDALSSATTSPQDQHQEPSSVACQTCKPTDQKVFLNGRIIMSHSTNLQQVLRMHTDLLNFTKTKHDQPDKHGVETRSRSRNRKNSENSADNSLNNAINKNTRPDATSQNNESQNHKHSKQEMQIRCDVSPHQKRHAPSKLGHQQDNDQQLTPPHQHRHHNQHHQLESQQHLNKQAKHTNQQPKSPQIHNKLETRT